MQKEDKIIFGVYNTKDKLFVLSIEEVVCKHFGDSVENLRNRV